LFVSSHFRVGQGTLSVDIKISSFIYLDAPIYRRIFGFFPPFQYDGNKLMSTSYNGSPDQNLAFDSPHDTPFDKTEPPKKQNMVRHGIIDFAVEIRYGAFHSLCDVVSKAILKLKRGSPHQVLSTTYKAPFGCTPEYPLL
jgi:hypothetical protein